ncbi:MAG: lipase family protein [Patescibacteria group bacterium]|nr:lipase family protein [Patescibacteria group bacterium]
MIPAGSFPNPSAQGFSWPNARTAAALSAAAYALIPTIYSPHTDAEVLVQDDANFICVAFRGSEELKDYLQDGKIMMDELITLTDGSVARVHSGFLQDFNSINEQLTNYVRAALGSTLTPGRKLIITGHSLGAALAVLCALEFEKMGLPVAWVFTFGQPRVGNDVFASIYNSSLGGRTFRIVNAGDPVPLMPPYLAGYRDELPAIVLPVGGGSVMNASNWEWVKYYLATWWKQLGKMKLWDFPDHRIGEYQRRIQLLA